MAKFRKSNLELQPNQKINFNNDEKNRIRYDDFTNTLGISGNAISLYAVSGGITFSPNLSAASREQDNRLQENSANDLYYEISNLTLPTSANQDDLRYEINNLTLPTSASIEDLDDIRYDLNTFTSPNSASLDDLHYEISNLTLPTSASTEDILSVSGSSVEQDNRLQEQIDGRIWTSAAASLDDLHDIRYDLNTFSSPNSASLDDLHYEFSNLTLPTSASLEDVEDVDGQLATHLASAGVHFLETDIDFDNLATSAHAHPEYDQQANLAPLSAASREQDQRLQEQIEWRLATSAAQIDHDDLRYDINTFSSPNSASQDDLHDIRYDLNTFSSPNSASQDDLHYELSNLTLPTSGSLEDLSNVSAASVEQDNRIQEQIDILGLPNRIVEGDSGISINDPASPRSITLSANGETQLYWSPSASRWRMPGGIFEIGKPNQTTGYILLRGRAAGGPNTGGTIDYSVAEQYRINKTYYRIGASEDNLFIGPNSAPSAMKYDGSNDFWNFSVPILGTTIDASTDFTVGGTVITNATITDDGTLSIVAASVDIPTGLLYVGENDSVFGRLRLYGSATQGGNLKFYNSVDDNGTNEHFEMGSATSPNFEMGWNNDLNMLKFFEAGTIQSTVAFDVDAAFSATTVDADTDFTVGGTVITDGQIADDGTLTLAATTAVQVSQGNLNLGINDNIDGTLVVYGDNANAGGTLQINLGANYDATINNYKIDISKDDLLIGPNTDPDALTYDGGNNRWEFRQGNVNIGNFDTTQGSLSLWAGPSGSDGGIFKITINQQYDAIISFFSIKAVTDDLLIGPNTDTDSLKYTGSNDLWNFTGTGLDVANALTADTVDADTDFTVGGTVITDNTITDDGTLTISTITSLIITDGAGAGSVSQVDIGVQDSVAGDLRAYGDNANTGGVLRLYPGANFDDPTNVWSIKINQDDLEIGTDDDGNMLKFIGGGALSIQSTVAFDVDAACTATTFDADTDFTVGGTVITDNTITDDGTLALVATNEVKITGAAGLYIGVNNNTNGALRLYGDAGAGVGGIINIYPTENSSGSIDYFRIQATQDDFTIGPDTDTDAFKLVGNGAAVTAEFTVGLTGTTIDVNTDFTVGGTVITDNTITDDGELFLATTSGVTMTGSGALDVGVNDATRAILNLYSTASTGPVLTMWVPGDDDGNGTTYFRLSYDANSDDFMIGADNDLDMLKFLGGATPTIQSTVAFDVDAACTATTFDADTDFTVGGTVITNNTITDDGTLVLASTTGVWIQDTVANSLTLLYVGIDNSSEGALYLYGDNASTGGSMRFYVGADEDGNGTDYFSIKLNLNDDLIIGADNDTDMMKFIGGAAPAIQTTVPLDVNPALTVTGSNKSEINLHDGTSTKAQLLLHTDDNLYIGTQGSTDKKVFIRTYNGSGSENQIVCHGGGAIDFYNHNVVEMRTAVNGISIPNGTLRVGTADSLHGTITIMGDAGASTIGGVLLISLAADHDDPINSYSIKGSNDDLWIGPDTDTDAFKLVGNGAAVTAEFTVGLTGTTIDATTDFTVGGTVITDGVITDDATLYLIATNVNIESMVLTLGKGTNYNGHLNLEGDPTAQGGIIDLYLADDSDTDIPYFRIQAINDDLFIGPDGNTDAFKMIGNGAAVTAEFTVGLTGTTIDATTDFTVGGTVITDNTITDDGTFEIVATAVDFTTGVVHIGVNDTTAGNLYLYASTSSSGQILIYMDADLQAAAGFDSYNIYNSEANFTIAAGADVKLYYDQSEASWNIIESSGDAILNIGFEDTIVGKLRLLSDGAGSVSGGRINIETAADYDATITEYIIQSYEDDLYIGPNTDLDSLKYNGANNKWEFTEEVVNFNNAKGDLNTHTVSADETNHDMSTTTGSGGFVHRMIYVSAGTPWNNFGTDGDIWYEVDEATRKGT